MECVWGRERPSLERSRTDALTGRTKGPPVSTGGGRKTASAEKKLIFQRLHRVRACVRVHAALTFLSDASTVPSHTAVPQEPPLSLHPHLTLQVMLLRDLRQTSRCSGRTPTQRRTVWKDGARGTWAGQHLHDGLSKVLGAPVAQARLQGRADVAAVSSRLVSVLSGLQTSTRLLGDAAEAGLLGDRGDSYLLRAFVKHLAGAGELVRVGRLSS